MRDPVLQIMEVGLGRKVCCRLHRGVHSWIRHRSAYLFPAKNRQPETVIFEHSTSGPKNYCHFPVRTQPGVRILCHARRDDVLRRAFHLRRRGCDSGPRVAQQPHARRRNDRPVLRVTEQPRLGRRADGARPVRQRCLPRDGHERRDGRQRRRHALALQLRGRDVQHEHKSLTKA